MIRRPAVWFAVAAAALLLPSLLLGTLNSHSSPQNLTWAGQFAEQFRAGILYPRWLADSFARLGGPAFYFYPPIGFWVDALLSVVTFDVPSVSYRLSFSSLILLWASGLAMHAWLKDEVSSPRVAFWGALAYMAAPYHLLDHYYRGAYAEFAAYVVLPLVALSIRRIAEGRRFAPLLLACSYAALPMSHLPTSLLISLTAIPLYVLYRGWRLGALFFLRCAAGGVLGLGLAAIYLVPALALQGWIPADSFWEGGYRFDNWFLGLPRGWPEPNDMMALMSWFALACGLSAVAVLATRLWRSEAVFWAIVCLVCLALVAGLPPWFWKIPFTAKVQFPWRLMIVVEFAAITALALLPWQRLARVPLYLVAAAVTALIPGVAPMLVGIEARMIVSRATPDAPADLKQFLPAGYPQKPQGGYAELSLGPVEGLPMIACTPQARTCRATERKFGGLGIEVDADAPTTVVLRRFYFPGWRLEPALAVRATDPLRLVSFDAPAGHSVLNLTRTSVREEQLGWLVSSLSVALLVLWAAVLRRGRQRTQ